MFLFIFTVWGGLTYREGMFIAEEVSRTSKLIDLRFEIFFPNEVSTFETLPFSRP